MPLAAKFGGTLIFVALGLIDRNEPSWLPSVMSGAPKFDRLPTRIRVASSTAPVLMKSPGKGGGGGGVAEGVGNPGIGEGKWHENGNEGGTGAVGPKNVPTCAMAQARGIFTATTGALTEIIACAHAARVAPPPQTAIPAAKVKMPRTVRLICVMRSLPSFTCVALRTCAQALA